MKILLRILVMTKLVISIPSLVCSPGEKTGNCLCDSNQREGYHLHCPSYQPKSKVLDLLYRTGQFVQVKCTQGISSQDVEPQLRGLNLGQLTTVKFVGCPHPDQSMDHLLSAMGVSGVRRLSFTNGRANDQESIFDFSNLTDLEILEFKYSDQLNVYDGFFDNIPNVKSISLNGIRNLNLHPNSFQNLTNLISLSIASSGLKTLDQDVFRNLFSMKDLNLHGNSLEQIPPHIFDDLQNLTKLNIVKNKLKSLPENIFINQENLQELIVGYNRFEYFPENFLAGKKKLKQFNMIVNGECHSYKRQCQQRKTHLLLPSNMFENSSIEFIKFLHVPVTDIPVSLFKNCLNLKNITFQGGFVSNIPSGLLKDTINLEKFDFVNNIINLIESELFDGLSNLKTLRLKVNKLSELRMDILSDLGKLKALHLSDNLLSNIVRTNKIYNLKHLSDIDLSNNNLDIDDVTNIFKSFTTDRHLTVNVENNKLKSDNSNDLANLLSQMYDADFINLSGNELFGNLNIDELEFNKFHTNLFLDLSKNQIERLIMNTDLETNNSVTISLSNNPYICDCHSSDIKQIMESDSSKLRLKKTDFKCRDPFKDLSEMLHSDLECPRSESCVESCTCRYNKFYKSLAINCQDQGLTELPELLPLTDEQTDTIHLYLEDNNLEDVSIQLERLIVNSSSHYNKISKLFLSGNKMEHFNINILPKKLIHLSLDRNLIKFIDNQTLQVLHENTNLSLRLSDNPYQCQCQNSDFHRFIRNRHHMVEDFKKVTVKCQDQKKALITLLEEEVCSPVPLLAIIFPTFIILFVLILILLVHIWYRDTIAIWLFSQTWGKLFFSEDLIDSNKPYDVFLSYSHHDADYVETELLPGLESESNPLEHQYRCLIHTRDWMVGEMIPDQILNSVNTSRRTLVVLSKEYVTATWTRMEFRAAHEAALRERTQRVIVVVRGKLPPKEEIDEDLQKYIKSNTFIESEDPWFWQKLRFALPKKSRKKNSGREKMSKENIIKLVFNRQFSADWLLAKKSKTEQSEINCKV